MIDSRDLFRGAFENGMPCDPAHYWYKTDSMTPDRLASVLTKAVRDRGVTGYRIRVERDGS